MYTLTTQSRFVVSTDFGKPMFWFVQDSKPANEGQAFLSQYLYDARTVFKNELEALLDTDRAFTSADATRLLSMLTLLIDARKTWQEEKDSTR